MDVTFSEEQQQLRSSVRDFLQDKSPEAAVRRAMATREGYDPSLWQQMGQLGLQGMAIPEKYGGTGFGYVDLGIVFEEMGRALLSAPFFASVALAAETLLRSSDEQAKADLLPGLASGACIGTLALLESSDTWSESGVHMTAARAGGDSWTLTGRKLHVLDGGIADLILVVARTKAGVGVFAVSGDAPGLTRTHLETMDQTRKQAHLEFAATAARVVGEAGGGWAAVEQALQAAAVLLAAEQVGGASRTLEMAVDYAKLRRQFGRPIGSFQAIKHKCADMLTDTESAKSAAYYGMWALAAGDADMPVAASLAKVYCSQAYAHTAAENIQIHGGIGFTWEHPAHLYFKRAKTSELLLGTASYHRGLLAQRLGL